MQLHPNAKTTPRGRLEIVQRVWECQKPGDVAEALGVSVRTVYKWVRRDREEGLAGLEQRRCAPHRRPRQTAPARARARVPRRALRAGVRGAGRSRSS